LGRQVEASTEVIYCLEHRLKLNFFAIGNQIVHWMISMKTIKLFFVFSAAALFIAACSQSGPTANQANTATNTAKANTAPPAQPAATVDELAQGKELYSAKCMICHKDTGKGGRVTVEGKNLKPADLTSDKVKARTNDKLMATISEGAPEDGMPPFKDKLSKDEMKLIVKYVRTLQGDQPAAQ
jgi:mono/diheme cytochrome c family protein